MGKGDFHERKTKPKNEVKTKQASMKVRPVMGPSNFSWFWAAASCFVLICLCALQCEAYPMHSPRQFNENRGNKALLQWLDEKDSDLNRYMWEVQRLRDLSHRMAITKSPQPTPQNYKRANTNCLFHAGLAHNCDYRDVIASVNEMSYWGSDLAPGKKRKKRSTKN